MRSSSFLASFTYLALVLAGLANQASAAAVEAQVARSWGVGGPGGPVISTNGHHGGGPGNGNAKCRGKLDVRTEWRDMKPRDKREYIKSVKCLMGKPPKSNAFGFATTRFDEFQVTHVALNDRIHAVGMFLPWHRRFVTLYTNALREECGYKGPTPFWDWTRDADAAASISESPVFDPDTGFGGDGIPGTFTLPPDPTGTAYYLPLRWKGCVADGPFADTVFNVGPGTVNTPHCLVRDLDDVFRPAMDSAAVAWAKGASTYHEFRSRVHIPPATAIHLGGHYYVGGEMGDAASSPGDPLFYLHHANLDRVWWQWQTESPEARFNDISGPSYAFGDDQITLDWVMDFPGIGQNLTVRDVMDPSKAPECYSYL